MGKKRKCRYTAQELAIHEEAVRLRKMTDRQLVEEFHRSAEPEIPPTVREEAQNVPGGTGATNDTAGVKKLLEALSEGKCKGIKGATVYKITEFATEMGLI